jgi:hypothetical protein
MNERPDLPAYCDESHVTRRKKTEKVACFFLGIGLIAAFFLLLALNVRGVVVIASANLDLSFVLWYVLLFVGLAILTKAFTIALGPNRENAIVLQMPRWTREPIVEKMAFWSVPWSRFFAGGLCTVIGIENIELFGLGNDQGAQMGQIFFLGGPSVAYLSGLYPLIFGVCLLGFCLFSCTRIQLAGSEHWVLLLEQRLPVPHLTEIPREELVEIRLRNTKFGGKFAWYLIFIPYCVLTVGYGVIFLLGPRATPDSLLLGGVLVGDGFAAVPILLLLIGWRQHFLEITTATKQYEQYFFLPALNREKQLEILRILGLTSQEVNGSVPPGSESPENSVTKHPWRRSTLVVGLVLIALAIFARVTYLGMGMLGAWGALLYGCVLVTKALTCDLPAPGFPRYEISEETKNFTYTWRRRRAYDDVKMFRSTSWAISTHSRPLDAFDVIGIVYLLTMMGIQDGQSWFFATGIAALGDIFAGTIASIAVLLLLLLYITYPTPLLIVESEHALVKLAVPPIPAENDSRISMRKILGMYITWLRGKEGRSARWRLFAGIAIFGIAAAISAGYWAFL